MAKKQENFLDYIPVISDTHTWDADEDGRVTVHILHRGIYAKIAQKFFHRPRVSHISLDAIGSFIFLQIDSKRSVGEIAMILKEKFGKKVEPLYDRLVQYMHILHSNQMIRYTKKSEAHA